MLEHDANSPEHSPQIRPEMEERPFHRRLREEMRGCHEEVDRLYGQFDLADRTSYADFLSAHASALFPLENWLNLPTLFPGAKPRSPALRSDLRELGRTVEQSQSITRQRGDADLWGTAYVIEGSRLGGKVLSGSVGRGLPHGYLSAPHPAGAWRRFLELLDSRARVGGLAWEQRAIAAARDAFALFAQAAKTGVKIG